MNPAQVLIIEDSPEVAEMLSTALESQGLQVEVAGDAESGIRIAQDRPFDLALIDQGLPGMHGLDACREFRADTRLAHIPVIMMTGQQSTDDKVLAFELGATDYINKPFNIPELIARVTAILRRKASIDQWVNASQREKERNHEELRRLGSAVDRATDAIIILDDAGRSIYINPSFAELFDVTKEDLLQPEQVRRLFVHQEVWKALWSTCQHRQPWSGEVALRSRNSRSVPCLCRANPLPGTEKQHGEVVLLFTDITERKRLENELLHLANHDPLTGLANRRYFAEQLSEAIERGRGELSAFLLYLDLDHFKAVNASAGYEGGDRLLKEIAAIIRVEGKTDDIVARFGGDDFVLFVPGIDEAGALERARRLVGVLDTYRFVEHGRPHTATASIGVARVDPSTTAEDNVSDVSSACYLAKERGRNGFALYQADHESLSQLSLESDWSLAIKDALRSGRMEIWLQPILPVREAISRVYFEVLLRMRDLEGKLILPGEFMPAAQRFGNMTQIDRYVIQKSVQLLQTNPALHLAINLSAQTLGDPGLPDFVESCFAASRVDPSRASFEITETATIQNIGLARQLIDRIKKRGSRFALDDFGSGFSSMTYLRDLPVDYVKIDGSFIRQLDHDPVSRSLVRAMNETAHILGKQTVAEYVTNAQVFDQVVDIGLDFAQGWHICEPAPPEKFLRDGISTLALP